MEKKILISGLQGAGKDTVADYLVEKYGFEKLTFATKIYEIARELFGMTTKDRWLLQQIGQKMREIDPNVWVKYTYNLSKRHDRVIISDCRQENEYTQGIKNEFVPIRIVANEETRIKRLTKRDGVEPDISLMYNECETGADSFYYYEIDNNKTFEDLYKKIDNLMEVE